MQNLLRTTLNAPQSSARKAAAEKAAAETSLNVTDDGTK